MKHNCAGNYLRVALLLCPGVLRAADNAVLETPEQGQRIESSRPAINSTQNDSENLLSKGAWTGAVMFGGAVDIHNDPGHPQHDLALSYFQAGYNFTGLVGESCWYRGFWEVSGELFGAVQL